MATEQSYSIRWKGQTSGPFASARLKQMLNDGDISLSHQLLKDGRWMTVEEFAETSGWLSKPKAAAPPQAPPAAVAGKRETQKLSTPTSPGTPGKPGGFAPPTLPRREAESPPPAVANIHVQKGGQTSGPYSPEQVKQMLDGGILSLSDEGWREGLANWVPLSSLLGIGGGPPGVGSRSTARGTKFPVMPQIVRQAANLLYASLVVTAIQGALAIYFLYERMGKDGPAHAFVGFISLLGVLAITWFLIAKASDGRNWARVVLLVSWLIALPFLLVNFAQAKLIFPDGWSGVSVVLMALASLLQLVALILIFTPEASRWFARCKAQRFADLLSETN
jgi:hypothetical protein